MRKLTFLIAALGSFCFSANAQSMVSKVPETEQTQVCKTNQGKGDVSCYKTKYAENFKVCKNENGYFICSEVSGYYDSSFMKFMGINDNPNGLNQNQYTLPANKQTNIDKTVPQSQSYVNTPSGSH